MTRHWPSTNHSSPAPGLHDGRVVGEHADGPLGRRHVGPLHYGHGGVVQTDLDIKIEGNACNSDMFDYVQCSERRQWWANIK